MVRDNELCSCSSAYDGNEEASLQKLADIRLKCPALLKVFLPDEVWPYFLNWHRQDDKVAYHRSVLLLALKSGYLSQVTSAVHRYLIDAGCVRQEVRKQYLKDLQESWMFYSDPMERHRKCRIFMGHLVELQFAEWLEQRSWSISGLEALREGPDIEATKSEGEETAFEVKFIGTEDGDFRVLLNSIACRPAGKFVSPYSAANYLLFRVFEAGKQLEDRSTGCIAVVIVEDLTWFRFKPQLSDGWINWHSPEFYHGDRDWGEFLCKAQDRYRDLPAGLPAVLQNLDAVWILRMSSDFQCHLEYEIHIRNA